MTSTTKPTCVEMFSGAGGAAIGLDRAGFEHLAMVEWDGSACAAARRSNPDWHVLEGDVDAPGLRAEVVRAVADSNRPLDLLWSSFPCQAWSMAGKRLGAQDPRNKWPSTVEYIDMLKPKWFLAENVRGLMSHLKRANCAKGARPNPEQCSRCYLDHVIMPALQARFAHSGYYLLDAADYGVPQHRRRIIIWAGPTPLEAPAPTHGRPGTPALKPWVSMGTALGLNVVDAETRKGTINVEGTPSRTIGTKGNTMVNVTQRVVGGGRNPKKGMGHKRNYRDLTDEPSTTVAAVRIGNAGPWICDVREAPEEPDALTGTREKWRGRPAPTVVASEVKGTRATPGRGYRFNGGPDRASDALWLATAKPDTDGKLVGRRRLTIAEVALLQGFPADWQFSGTKTAQYAQVGNAVPPKMAEVVGRTIIEEE